MEQLSFSALLPRRFPDLNPHIEEQFVAFHTHHPEVFDLFKTFASDVRTRGFAHYSSKALMERIRWYTEIETGQTDFKINNNFSSGYARLLIQIDPSFSNFFALRHTPGTVEIH